MTSNSDQSIPRWLRLSLGGLAMLWWLAEWALALPPMIHQGFGPWHRAALLRLRHDPAFLLVVLDYFLTYAIAFALSVRQAYRDGPRRWLLWTCAFVIATAPAMLLFWVMRRPLNRA